MVFNGETLGRIISLAKVPGQIQKPGILFPLSVRREKGLEATYGPRKTNRKKKIRVVMPV